MQRAPTRRDFLASAAALAAMAPAGAAQAVPRITTGTIDVGGVRLPYWDTGGPGFPVILLHPFAGSLESWPYQQTAFRDAGYRVIAYSRRGVGTTEPINTPINHAEDLARFTESLGIPRAHLVSVSGGAIVAADFLISYPKRVTSIVFACSLISYQDPLLLAARRAAPVSPDSAPENELSEGYRKDNPEGTQRWLEIYRRAHSAASAPRAQTNAVTLDAIAATHVPVMVLAGEFDRLLTPTVLKAIRGKLPGAETHIIRHAGHQGHWENPAAFNEFVLTYLRRHPAA